MSLMVEAAENYQVRAYEDNPQEIARATARGLRRVARTANASLRRASLWDRALGPFLGEAGVADKLGVSLEEVRKRTEAQEFVAATTSDGVICYPTFQFANAQLRAGLAMLFSAVRSTGIDDWTAAGWLVAEHPDLGDMTAEEWLLSGGDAGRARLVADDTANRFAH